LVSALLAGCASTDLEGSDRGVLMPTVRAVFDLSEGGEGDQDSGPMRFDHGFELAATGASDSMVLDGVVGGPGDVSYQALHGSALYRVGFDGRRAAVHGLVGVGVDRVELTDNPLVRGEEGYAGPMVGVEAELRVRDWFAPYLRLTTQVMDQGAFSQQFEIGARFPTCSAADVLVAWRSWDAEYEDLARTGQDLEVDWRGFVLGFGLRF
jgi:hypothetical protein